MNAHRAIEHDMEGAPPDFDLKTLSGDLRDAMLSRIRQMRTTWPLCTEVEQSDIVNGLELAAKAMVREVVKQLTSFEFDRAVVTLNEMKMKPGKDLEIKVSCPNIEVNRNVLGHHMGAHVLLLMVDSDEFMAERAKPDIQPDQMDMFAAPPPDEAGTTDQPEGENLALPAPGGETEADAQPTLLHAAIRAVVDQQKCSASYIQRRLSIGFNIAAGLIEQMERHGIVSAPNLSGKREVLCATEADALQKAGLAAREPAPEEAEDEGEEEAPPEEPDDTESTDD